MKMRVLGIQMQDYTSRRTGNPVKGVSLHCAYKDQQVIGEMVDNIFISNNLDCIKWMATVQPGQWVDVEFNRRGYVADAHICSETPATPPAPPAPETPAKPAK